MKFAHKMSNVPGGNKVVTVTEHNGKALVKVTLIPTEHAKQHKLTMKQLVKFIEKAHEQALAREATK